MMAFYLKTLSLFIFIYVYVSADSIDFSNCGPDYKIIDVELEGCAFIPCKLKIGNSYNINMTIIPTYKSESLSQMVYVTLFDAVDVKIDILPDNPCASIPCPVLVSDRFEFSGRLIIGDNLVEEKGVLWWKMVTTSGRTAVCMKTSVIIENRTKLKVG